MRAWHRLAFNLVNDFPSKRKWYAILFAVVVTAANIESIYSRDALGLHTHPHGLLSVIYSISTLLYAVLSVVAVFVLSGVFTRRLGSGQAKLRALAAAKSGHSAVRRRLYTVAFTVIICLFALALGLVGAWITNVLLSLLTPVLTHTHQNIGLQRGNIAQALMLALLACTEEYWRWSIILTVLLICKRLNQAAWTSHRRFRQVSFTIALIVSSLIFGIGHVAEFNHAKGEALFFLSVLGFGFACFAIVTQRFWLAVILHFVYDVMSMIPSLIALAPTIALIALAGIPVLFWFKRQQEQLDMNLS